MDYPDQMMEKIVSLCKRRGFIFQGSEIYGGLAGTYDYGPLGTLLKNNIRDSWLKTFVHGRTDMYLLDAAILMNQRVWQATGHVDEFVDPLVEDLVTHKRYRADHLLEEQGVRADMMSVEEMTATMSRMGIVSPTGNMLGPVKQFNMMLATRVGAMEDSSAVSYLRPETAQGIFVNYKNVLDSQSPKLPFGIAQVGKAFRNEITPRDFIFRLRELEQMEIEYFIREAEWEVEFDRWMTIQREWLLSAGIADEALHVYEHPAEGRAHYSKRTVDFEFDFPFGTKELTGCAYRTDFDLSRHAEHSGARLDYFDQDTNTHITPHFIEPTFGLDRMVLAVMCSSFREEISETGSRTYLQLPKHLAPYLVCVSPLLRNKPALVEKARGLFDALKSSLLRVAWDDNSNIGKRYARHDEIGTPFCVVVDFDTLEDDTVTVRNRDTGLQERISTAELVAFIS